MTTKDLTYPVIDIYEKGGTYISASIDEDTLCTMSSGSLKHGRYIGCTIIDSNGTAVKIEDARFVSGKGSFWGYTMFLNRMIEVELVLGKPFEMPLEQVRKKVLRALRRGASSIDQESAQEQTRLVEDAQSIRELIQIVLPIFDMREFWRRFKRL